eukprot:g2856.t1
MYALVSFFSASFGVKFLRIVRQECGPKGDAATVLVVAAAVLVSAVAVVVKLGMVARGGGGEGVGGAGGYWEQKGALVGGGGEAGGSSSERLSFVIAYDGSIASRNSLNLCTDFFMKHKPESTLDVLHLYDPKTQPQLQYAYKAKTIEGELAGYSVVFGPHRYRAHVLPHVSSGVEQEVDEAEDILRDRMTRAEQIGKTLLEYTCLKTTRLAAANVPVSVAMQHENGRRKSLQVGPSHLLGGVAAYAAGGGGTSGAPEAEDGGSSATDGKASTTAPAASSSGDYVDFLVLGFKHSTKFKSVDQVLLSSSIHYCLQKASSSMIIVKNKFDSAAFAKYLSVAELLQQRRTRAVGGGYNVFGDHEEEDRDDRKVGKGGGILKGASSSSTRGCHIVVCVDGMPWSEKALADALRISGLERSALPSTSSSSGSSSFSANIKTCGSKNCVDRITLLNVVNAEQEDVSDDAAVNAEQHFLTMRQRWVERLFAHVLYTDEGAEDRLDRERAARKSLQKQETARLLAEAEEAEVAARRAEWERCEETRRNSILDESRAGEGEAVARLEWKDDDDAEVVQRKQEEQNEKQVTAPSRSSASAASKSKPVSTARVKSSYGLNRPASAAAGAASALGPKMNRGTAHSSRPEGRTRKELNSVGSGGHRSPSKPLTPSKPSGRMYLPSAAPPKLARKFRGAVRSVKWSQKLKIQQGRKCFTKDEKLQMLLDKIQLRTIRNSGQGVAKDILDFVDEENASLICIGTDAEKLKVKNSYLGSVAAHVLCEAAVPVVVARYDPESFNSVF